jgi:hypothetical protein
VVNDVACAWCLSINFSSSGHSVALYEAMRILHTSQFKKTLWISILTASFAFVILILAPSKAFAWTEYFDGVSSGIPITNISGWETESATGYINNSVSYSAPNSAHLQTQDNIYRFATTTGDAEIKFRFYITHSDGTGGTFRFWTDDSINLQTNYGSAGSYCYIGGGGNSSLRFTCDAWHELKISIVSDNNLCSGIWNGYTWFNRFWVLDGSGGEIFIDDLSIPASPPAPPASSLIIDSPASGSTASSTFSLNFTYNLAGENYNKLLVTFEAWTIIGSTTCPVYGTPEWTEEYNNGWFYNQSLPYFSPRLTATSTGSTSSIAVYNLDEPYFYNCVHCYFYNSDTGTSTMAEKCPDYTLNVVGSVPPSQPVPIGSWQSYYASHTSDKFGTSTEIFDNISETFNGIVSKLTSFVNDFRNIFDAENANAQGTELGQKIPLARGYLKPINDFFGGTPISELFMLVLLILLVVVIYRIVARILHLVRG